MGKVHCISPLNEEACGWRVGPGKQPALAPVGQQQQQQQQQPWGPLQTCPSLQLPTEPTPLLFQLEDVPSPIQRATSTASTGSAAGQCQATIDTLQLLLGPASEGEAMLHVHVKVAQERVVQAAAPAAQAGGSSSGAAANPDTRPAPLEAAAAAAGDGGGSPRDAPLDPAALAATFVRLGYNPVKVRSSNLKLAHRKGLQHQYVTVHAPDGSPEGCTFIVDLAFKDQFVVASPTPRYRAVLDSLSPHVIASKGCLRQAVVLLCSELALCFAERGLPVPPWRTPAALLARWHLQSGAST